MSQNTGMNTVKLYGDFHISYADPTVTTAKFWIIHKNIIIRSFEFGAEFDACCNLIRLGATVEQVIDAKF